MKLTIIACALVALAGCSKSNAATTEEAKPTAGSISVADYCKRIVSLSDADDRELAKDLKNADPATKKEIAAMKADLHKECVTSVGKAQKKDPDAFQVCAQCAQGAKDWKAFVDGCDDPCDAFAMAEDESKP